MRFPSKVTPFKNSIFYKSLIISEQIEKKISIIDLQKKTKEQVEIEEFIDSLAILILFEKIIINNGMVYLC